MKTKTIKNRKTPAIKTVGEAAKKIKAAALKTPKVKTTHYYVGQPIPASKLYVKAIEGFSAKQGNQCKAQAWLLVNEIAGTATYCNTYSENNLPKSSYDPAHYTHPINEKVLSKKIEIYSEVEDREEWPSWVSFASKRKAAK